MSFVTFENRFYELYLDFFRHAEAGRRWNIDKDIPWDKCNPETNDKVAYLVEGFTGVEMYLPDYTSKILHLVRKSRGRAWFQANWGYEESKHSIALDTWLVRSGKRTQEQVREYGDALLEKEWDMPFNTPTQMMVYTTLQELATQLNYRRLRELARQENDEALVATLNFIGRDEAAHHKFFKDGVKLLLEEDRDKTLEDIQIVLSQFKMPAIDLIPDWQEYLNTIVDMGLFSARLYMTDVVQPVLKAWDISRAELKTVMRESSAGIPKVQPSLNFVR